MSMFFHSKRQRCIKNITYLQVESWGRFGEDRLRSNEEPLRTRNESSFELSSRVYPCSKRLAPHSRESRTWALDYSPWDWQSNRSQPFIGANDKRNDSGSLFPPDISRSTICDAKSQLLPAAIFFT